MLTLIHRVQLELVLRRPCPRHMQCRLLQLVDGHHDAQFRAFGSHRNDPGEMVLCDKCNCYFRVIGTRGPWVRNLDGVKRRRPYMYSGKWLDICSCSGAAYIPTTSAPSVS